PCSGSVSASSRNTWDTASSRPPPKATRTPSRRSWPRPPPPSNACCAPEAPASGRKDGRPIDPTIPSVHGGDQNRHSIGGRFHGEDLRTVVLVDLAAVAEVDGPLDPHQGPLTHQRRAVGEDECDHQCDGEGDDREEQEAPI